MVGNPEDRFSHNEAHFEAVWIVLEKVPERYVYPQLMFQTAALTNENSSLHFIGGREQGGDEGMTKKTKPT